MKTAIVILNWNGQKLLEQFLPSVVNFSSTDATVYVADNASTDTSIEFIKVHYPSVQIIQNSSNGGYAKGYNDALQHVNADIYCLLNSDVEVTENWLSPIINVFKSEDNTAIIQPKLLDYKDKTKFEYAGAAGGFLDVFGYPYCRGRVFNELETDTGEFDDIADVFWASGACLFIRSKVYHQVHGFDEDYFAHQEEIDLCWRTKNLGYAVKYVGTATVYHVGGATLKETNPHKTFLNFRNSLFNIVKNVPKRWCLMIVLARLLLDGIAGVKFMIELRPIHTWSILKAHVSFYRYLLTCIKKRNNQQKITAYYMHTSIVWQYFFLKRKKFKQLR